jgi:hypothetical protein
MDSSPDQERTPIFFRLGRRGLVTTTLAKLYGTRPYWQGPKIDPANVPADEVDMIISHLLPCESLVRDVDEIDSNAKMSYGPGQFQSSTWNAWSAESGIVGSPDDVNDMVSMMRWAIEHGLLPAWSCATILKMF